MLLTTGSGVCALLTAWIAFGGRLHNCLLLVWYSSPMAQFSGEIASLRKKMHEGTESWGGLGSGLIT